MLTIKYKYTKSASTLGRAMIQNGDKFTVLDLCESVRSATSADLRQYVANIKKHRPNTIKCTQNNWCLKIGAQTNITLIRAVWYYVPNIARNCPRY